jgi:site-specific DNA recombinase
MHILDMAGMAINTKSPMGRFFFVMLAAFAEFERDLISERITSVMRFKKQQGDLVGTVPFGFSAIGKKLMPFPDELNIIRKIFARHQDGYTLQWIANELNRYHIHPKRKGEKFYPSTIRAILRNKAYYDPYLTENPAAPNEIVSVVAGPSFAMTSHRSFGVLAEDSPEE